MADFEGRFGSGMMDTVKLLAFDQQPGDPPIVGISTEGKNCEDLHLRIRRLEEENRRLVEERGELAEENRRIRNTIEKMRKRANA